MRALTWQFDGITLPYQVPTQGHERDIELPFGRWFLDRNRRRRILEVGNSTQLLYPHGPRRDIVCQYDTLGGPLPVERQDIAQWWRRPYGAILSISTLEHIGYEYGPIDDLRAWRAVEHCIGLLGRRGEFAFTIPCGFHPSLDRTVVEHRADWDALALMVRTTEDNEWVQRPVEEYDTGGYPGGWGCAGKILIVRYRRS